MLIRLHQIIQPNFVRVTYYIEDYVEDYVEVKEMKNCIRLADIKKYTGLSASSIWRLEDKGVFPKRRQLGGRAVGWLRCEIEEWLKSRQIITIGNGPKVRKGIKDPKIKELDNHLQPMISNYFFLIFLGIAHSKVLPNEK
jgi:prophage regulatory protein